MAGRPKPIGNAASASRLKSLPAFLLFVVFGLGLMALGAPDILRFAHDMANRAPVVDFTPRNAVGLPLALAAFGLAGLTLSRPEPPQGPRRRTRPPGTDSWKGLCLGVTIAAVFLTVLTVPVLRIATPLLMADAGYARCSAPIGDRHAGMRWTLPGVPCSGGR